MMRPHTFTALLERRVLTPSRIESAGFNCRAVCGSCQWTGPQRGGAAGIAYDTARTDLLHHYREAIAA